MLLEVLRDIPDLRLAMLVAGSERIQDLYRRELGMEVLGEQDGETLVAMGARKAPLPNAKAEGSQA